MKKRIVTFLITLLFIPLLTAKTYRVNTQNSSFNELKNDVCEYNDETKTMQCTKKGTVQRVSKECGNKKTGGQFVGTITVDKKTCNLYAITAQQAIEHNAQALSIAETIAQQLFNPANTTTPPTSNPFPSTSINETAVEKSYGANGLKLNSTLLDYFKKFYFYFEYIVKMEYAARLVALAPTLGVDFITMLEKSLWQDFVSAMVSKAGDWTSLEKKLFSPEIIPQWQALKGLLPSTSWQNLSQSSFWNSLNKITTTSLINSTAWQNYLKYSIARTFVQDSIIITSINQIDQELFLYIPNIEIAYYHPDFVALRNGAEMYHVSLLLTDAFRNRLLEHCNDWNTFKDQKTGAYDLVKIYGAIKDFEQTSFYKVAVLGEHDASATFNDIANKNLPPEVKLLQEQPNLHDQIILFSMIKILHALTHYVYDKNNLDTTMNFIEQLSSTGPQPSILLYSTGDYIYLDDLNHLHDVMQEHAALQASHSQNPDPVTRSWNKMMGSSSTNTVQVQSWSSFWHSIKHAFTSIWDDIKKTGEEIFHTLEKAGESLFETIESGVLEIAGGIAKIPGLGEVLTGLSPSKADSLLREAAKLRRKAVDDIQQAGVNLDHLVTDIADTAETAIKGIENVATELVENIGEGIGIICNTVLAGQDTELCSDITGVFVTNYEILIQGLANLATDVVVSYGGLLRLGADAVALVAKTAVDLVVGDYKDLGSELVDGLKKFGIDTAVLLLNELTYTFKFFYDDLLNALKLAQYFISILTRIFIDAATAATFVGAGVGWIFDHDINPFHAAQAARDTLGEHERIINAGITTILLVATIPLTGGYSSWIVLPTIALTVGSQIIQIVSSAQEDELKKYEKDEQHKFVEDFGTFIDASKLVYQQQQLEITNELQLKYQAELSNEERSVGFYENFINKNFEALKNQLSFLLENWWSQLLTPDSYGLAFGDVGSIYGIKTGTYNLNPSQGFSLYSTARDSFSQEIAVLPELVSQNDTSLLAKKAVSKNWFNQKETVPLAQSINEVEIKFKAIYLLNTFYIGIYVGGKELNIADIINKNKTTELDLVDLDHLAKMVVFKRDTSNQPVALNVYEHEGKGWFDQSLPANSFSVDTWYHLALAINGSSLTVRFWSEENPSTIASKTYTVTQLASQKVIGVISSGAAIEYQYIKPIIPIAPVTQLRPTTGYCKNLVNDKPCLDENDSIPFITEKTREKEAQNLLSYKITPNVGAFSLKAVDKTQILKDQFIYKTNSTHLVNSAGNSIDDYVIMGTINSDFTVSDAGKYPKKEDDIISLVTKKAFYNNGTYADVRVIDAFTSYVSNFPLPDSLVDSIKKLQQDYLNENMNIVFGPFKLQAASTSALEHYQFIYTIPLLNNGKALKDAKGKTLLDYMLVVVLEGSNIDPNFLPGLSYNDMLAHPERTYGLVSLVTFNLYNKASQTPINTNIDVLSIYQQTHVPLENDLLAAIMNSRSIYQQQVTVNPTTPTIKVTGGAKNVSSTSTPGAGNKGPDVGTGTKEQPIKPPAENLSDRISAATGDPSNIDFGG